MHLFDLKGFLLLCLVFVPLERLLAMHPGQKVFRRGWSNDLIYVFVNALLIKAGLAALLVMIILGAEWFVPKSFQAAVAAQPYWLQILELLAVADLGFYLAHRMFHAIPWLWRFHAVHHSIEELDWLAAHRVHPVDQIITKGASLLPCFALGFSEVAIGIWALLYHWHSVLLHANVRINIGPLRWLVASPEFHHWHHSNHREAYDKNFAGQLSVLDVLFGTLHMPRGRLPTKYGVDEPVPQTYIPQLLYPFRKRGDDQSSATDDRAVAGEQPLPVAMRSAD